LATLEEGRRSYPTPITQLLAALALYNVVACAPARGCLNRLFSSHLARGTGDGTLEADDHGWDRCHGSGDWRSWCSPSSPERYVFIEVGHAAENVLLEATALGLAAVPVAAFDDDALRGVLGVGAAETPLYILCVGRPPH
jgi:hypothetical protein